MTGGLGMFFTEMNDIVQQISKRRGILINHNNCGHLMPKIENIHDEFETNQSWSNVIQFSMPIYHTYVMVFSCCTILQYFNITILQCVTIFHIIFRNEVSNLLIF